MIGFAKTNQIVTTVEIQFNIATVHADIPGLLLQAVFCQPCKPQRFTTESMGPLMGTNKAACMGCQTAADDHLGTTRLTVAVSVPY